MDLQIKKVMMTTDLSGPSWKALEPAVAMAEGFDAQLVVFLTQPPVNAALGGYDMAIMPVDLAEVTDKRRRESEDKIREKLASISTKKPIEVLVTESKNPAREIVEKAKELEVDILVIATHGRTGMSHILYGSTAEKVVRRSPVPVLSIRAFPPPAEDSGKKTSEESEKERV